MGKAVQMFCSGDWDPRRVPEGSENLDSLLSAAPSHLPRPPRRCFTGEGLWNCGTKLCPVFHVFHPASVAVLSLTPAVVNFTTSGGAALPALGLSLAAPLSAHTR